MMISQSEVNEKYIKIEENYIYNFTMSDDMLICFSTVSVFCGLLAGVSSIIVIFHDIVRGSWSLCHLTNCLSCHWCTYIRDAFKLKSRFVKFVTSNTFPSINVRHLPIIFSHIFIFQKKHSPFDYFPIFLISFSSSSNAHIAIIY